MSTPDAPTPAAAVSPQREPTEADRQALHSAFLAIGNGSFVVGSKIIAEHVAAETAELRSENAALKAELHLTKLECYANAKAMVYNASLLDFLDAEAKRRGCDLTVMTHHGYDEPMHPTGIEWGEGQSVRAAIEEARQA